MFGEPGLLEHVPEALLAPPAARFGRGAQGVDQMAGLVADLPLPRPHQLDRLAQPGILVDALLLDPLKPLL